MINTPRRWWDPPSWGPPRLVFAALGAVRADADRRFHKHLLHSRAVKVDEHRLATDEVPARGGKGGSNASHACHGDQGRRRVDAFGHVEGGRDGVPAVRRLAGAADRAALDETHLATAFD